MTVSFIDDGSERETRTLTVKDCPWWKGKESITIRLEMIGADDDWIQAHILRDVRISAGMRARREMDMEAYARVQTLTLFRMIQQITDENGRAVAVTEDLVRRIKKRTRDYLTSILDEANPGPVEPTEEDEQKADARMEHYHQRGVPPQDDAVAEVVAEDSFRPGDQGDLSGQALALYPRK